MRSMRDRRRAPLALGLGLTLLLTACSGDGDQEAEESPSAPSASASDYLDVPDGVELTEQGSELSLGDSATVAYQPKQGVVGVVDLRVTRIERASIKDFAAFKLDKRAARSTPYYVSATVRNAGSTNLADTIPPLYLDDGRKLITPSRFTSRFGPCASTPLPRGFKKSTKYSGCWVYLVAPGGSMESMSFYPTDSFDPITWTGDVTSPGDSKKKGKQSKQGKKKR